MSLEWSPKKSCRTSKSSLYDDGDVSTTISGLTSPSSEMSMTSGIPSSPNLPALVPDELDAPLMPSAHSGPFSWRRRKYVVPSCVRSDLESPRPRSEVIMEGPLQVRRLGVLWPWRWCVLYKDELRIYEDDAIDGAPLQALRLGEVMVAAKRESDGTDTQVFELSDPTDGRSLVTLCAGSGDRWEEFAAARLWLLALRGGILSARRGATEKLGVEKERVGLANDRMGMASRRMFGETSPMVWGALAGA